jgi:hypothetical protein
MYPHTPATLMYAAAPGIPAPQRRSVERERRRFDSRQASQWVVQYAAGASNGAARAQGRLLPSARRERSLSCATTTARALPKDGFGFMVSVECSQGRDRESHGYGGYHRASKPAGAAQI